MGQKHRKREVVDEYLRGGVTLRELEVSYGIARQTIHRWVQESVSDLTPEETRGLKERRKLAAKQSEIPAEVRQLQKELEEARLYNELLNTMIDIAEDQLGVDIRKKRGAKR